MPESNINQAIKMMIVIVERDRTKKTLEIFRKNHAKVVLTVLANGTANSEILDILGLDGSDKLIVIALGNHNKTEKLLYSLTQDLQLNKRGHGIAFTLLLSSIVNPLTKILAREECSAECIQIEREVIKMDKAEKHDLIAAVINQGYSDELMEAASDAGAKGGTVIHARQLMSEKMVNFFGIPIQEEKEIVFLLVSHEHKKEIMQSIIHQCGIKTPAHGILFSLPAENVSGLESMR